MNKREYPFVIRLPYGGSSDNRLLRARYAGFLILLLFVVFWLLSGRLETGAVAALCSSVAFGIVLTPHALARARSKAIRTLAAFVMGMVSLGGFSAGSVLLYLLFVARPGTGAFAYYLAFMLATGAALIFWLSYGYAFQIVHYLKHPPGDESA